VLARISRDGKTSRSAEAGQISTTSADAEHPVDENGGGGGAIAGPWRANNQTRINRR
jgi:hypothetical protein